MKQKRFFYFLVLCLLLAFVLVVGKDYYLRALGSFLVVKDNLQTADAIVVLGGESERLDQAVKLYKEGFSKFIIVSGGRGNASIKMEQEAVQAGIPAQRILLETKGWHTYQQPIFVKPIIVNHGFTSVIVVSSPYHMRRVVMLFDRTFHKTGIKLIYYPVMNSWFDSQHWWQSEKGRYFVFWEYAKMSVNFWGVGVNDFILRVDQKV